MQPNKGSNACFNLPGGTLLRKESALMHQCASNFPASFCLHVPFQILHPVRIKTGKTERRLLVSFHTMKSLGFFHTGWSRTRIPPYIQGKTKSRGIWMPHVTYLSIGSRKLHKVVSSAVYAHPHLMWHLLTGFTRSVM